MFGLPHDPKDLAELVIWDGGFDVVTPDVQRLIQRLVLVGED